jgi:hypothetical protein
VEDERSAAKAGRSHGYCWRLGRAQPRGHIAGLGRHAEHRALLLMACPGEASRANAGLAGRSLAASGVPALWGAPDGF